MHTRILIALAAGLMAAPAAWAESFEDELSALRTQVQELKDVVSRLNQTVQAQEARITALTAQQDRIAEAAEPRPAAVAGSASTPEPAASPGGRSGLSAFNPEIGVIADIVASSSESREDAEGNDRIAAREVELVFGHPIDPYSRLDVTAAFSDFEEASLEEAYLTHWGIPGITARLGRMRQRVGKANSMHRDSLETVDEPLVIANYLGAEGLARAAAEVSGFLPLPWESVTHELIGGVMEGGVGEGGTLFGETRRRPSAYARLRNFWEVSDFSSAEFGASYLVGSSDEDASAEVHALGLDATLVHHFTPTRKLKWQNEIFLQERDEYENVAIDADTGAETTSFFNENPWGLYSLLDFRISPRFGVGGRFDYVEPVNVDPLELARAADTAYSGYLTFYQSEFARWRLQVRHTERAEGGEDDAVFLQATVAIGAHKHAIQ